jgi:hypothetical protein
MLSEIVLSSISDAVFAHLIDHAVQNDRLRRWLGLQPACLAFHKSLARAYITFARHYPDLAAALFDQSFLQVEAAPEIAKLLIRGQAPDAVNLARLWMNSIGRKPADRAIDSYLVEAASEFCGWLEAELKAETALQALFDSRALDSLPAMEAKLDILVQELTHFRQQALQIAESYEKTIQQHISIHGSQNIVGDHNSITIFNQYFLADTLKDLYQRPDAVFQRVGIGHFTGREWLEGKLDAFLQSNRSGVFLLVGEAGVGKTAFLAHLVKQRNYMHLFAEQMPGDAYLPVALRSLGAQIVSRYQIAEYAERDTLPQVASFPSFLDDLIRMAADKLNAGEKLVIVCDALDEAGTGLNGNVFGLPKVLPDGVFLILSKRPVDVHLRIDCEVHTENLTAQSAENIQDVQSYLTAVSQRPTIAAQLKVRGYSSGEFVRILSERSGGIWMYLHYVIQEIEKGSRHPLDLQKLPSGLAGYYADFWSGWRDGRRGDGKSAWNAQYAPLLGLVAAVQEPASARQLAHWCDMKAEDIEFLLGEQWRPFITEQEGQEGELLYRIYHASLRDFICGRLNPEGILPDPKHLLRDLSRATQAAHRKIVESYQAECSGNWVCLVAQDYPRRYLAYHLAEAGELATLYTLTIESDAWAKEKFRLEGHYDSYLSDLAVVFDVLKKDRDVGRLMRAAFCQASIISSAGKISTELLNACVAENVIPLEVALVYIGQTNDSKYKFQGYFAFWQGLPEEQRKTHQPRLLALALRYAIKIYSELYRSRALVELAPHLSTELKAEVLTKALYVARSIVDEDARSCALTELAPHLPSELKAEVLTEALSAARSIQREYARFLALVKLAAHPPTELLTEALAAVRSIANKYDRSLALIKLAPYLSAELKSEVLTEALSAASSIAYEYTRSSALIKLAPHLPADLLTEALSAARSIKWEDARCNTLNGLAPYLPEELMVEALSAICSIANEDIRSSALVELAPHMSKELLTEALSIARSIQWKDARARALSGLAPHLPAELMAEVLTEVLSAARSIADEDTRSRALSRLALHLSAELRAEVLTEALSTARSIQRDYARSCALVELATHLPPELRGEVLTEALSAAISIADKGECSHTLVELSSHLPADLLIEALSAARSIENEDTRYKALIELVPHLPVDLLTEVLSAARSIADEDTRSLALTGLAPHLSAELKSEALTEALFAARSIQREYARSHALTELAPHLPPELRAEVLNEALTTTLSITDDYARSRALIELAPHLPADSLTKAFFVAYSIVDEDTRSHALSGLAPHLPAELMTEALSAARSIVDEDARSSALTGLAPYLPAELMAEVLTEALSAARNILREDVRSRTLVELAPHLPAELLTEALSVARSIADEDARSSALTGLAPYLPAELMAEVLTEALSVARRIANEYARSNALTELAPHLPEEFLIDALSAARSIQREDLRSIALAELAPLLDVDKLSSLLGNEILEIGIVVGLAEIIHHWKEIAKMRSIDEYQMIVQLVQKTSSISRIKFLEVVEDIAPLLLRMGGQNGVNETARAILDTGRWWP